MDTNTEMDLYSSPVSSPASSPNPTTQNDSPWISRQKVQEIDFLSVPMENKAATLNAYKSRRFFDENNFLHKAELSQYREAEARQQYLVSAFIALPPFEFNGCLYHSELMQQEIKISSINTTTTPQKGLREKMKTVSSLHLQEKLLKLELREKD
ncbi:hypothetical protein NPIL_226161 [Nephila pilipes]|uniref:Uncharacterized protein n=1 Tax=Nephila pilipes TaxID=299642 RepID=A0A8X6UNB7_NEPPI|nr:hypothetical protein NPIL_226161 [Nephila pilipes]